MLRKDMNKALTSLFDWQYSTEIDDEVEEVLHDEGLLDSSKYFFDQHSLLDSLSDARFKDLLEASMEAHSREIREEFSCF